MGSYVMSLFIVIITSDGVVCYEFIYCYYYERNEPLVCSKARIFAIYISGCTSWRHECSK